MKSEWYLHLRLGCGRSLSRSSLTGCDHSGPHVELEPIPGWLTSFRILFLSFSVLFESH